MAWRLLKWFWTEPVLAFTAARAERVAVAGQAGSESNVVLLYSPKDPKSKEDFNWDCTALLKATDTIASVTKIFVERGDSSITILSVPAISSSGRVVSARLGGGRRGQRYRLTIYFSTATGEELDFSLEFACA